MRKFKSEFDRTIRPAFFADPVLDLNLGSELEVFGNVTVDKGDKTLLVEIVGDPLAIADG